MHSAAHISYGKLAIPILLVAGLMEMKFICGTTEASIVGCCERRTGSALCGDILTTCYDFLGVPCDTACQANLNNLICISPTPYCVKYLYTSGSIGYGCGPYSRLTKTVALTINSNGAGPLTGVGASDSITSSSSSSTTSSTLTTLTTSSSSLTPTHSSTNLSGGAIAGVSIGSALGVVLISLTIWWIFMKRPRSSSAESTHQESEAGGNHRSIRDSETLYGSVHSPKILGPSPGQQGSYVGPTMPEMDGERHR
ncbi:uncharacterized protein PAC_00950 [Phialocephala subalpina]|uniref:Extracellular membrane protein CFEM domain-containing protein n=1 Tax=Phialocephala subalpina TaxID=576137 RepID=A0A1L7WE53_9HELO|nr:uncharacterized protein PAC_00950 [Phialocephala subalpina]